MNDVSPEKPHLLKHLEFVQLTIIRLAANSFIVKGWSVTLVAAILAFTGKDSTPAAAWFALLPALMFWGLDAYYLRIERLYRNLYDKVRQTRGSPDSEVDFSLDVSSLSNQETPWIGVAFSKTLFPFYISLIAVIVVVAVLGQQFQRSIGESPQAAVSAGQKGTP